MRNATHASRRAATVLLAAMTMGTALDGPLLGAEEVRMAIDGGRVTLSAIEAPLADVLAELVAGRRHAVRGRRDPQPRDCHPATGGG